MPPNVVRIEGHSFLARDLRTVVDLGANVGSFAAAIRLRYPGATVYAAEADEQLAKRSGADWTAVAGHDGNVELRKAGGDATISLGGDVYAVVPATTLTTFLDSYSLRHVDLLKVDIEGAELDLIEHDAAALTRCDQIAMEFHDFLDLRLTPRVAAARERLRRLGFAEIRFSLDNTDVLYLRERLSPAAEAWVMVRYKYLRGLHRRYFSSRPAVTASDLSP